jgi:hypothetical protein
MGNDNHDDHGIVLLDPVDHSPVADPIAVVTRQRPVEALDAGMLVRISS